MLIELRIENLAVVERLSLRLAPGLNALTGETGAGKSIIVGALSLLLGERASAEVVRPGATRARVEGVFDISARPRLHEVLVEHGVDTGDDLLILRREVAVEGRNRAWVNGSAATAALLADLGRQLVDLHGQHEHQTLLRPDEQRDVLDAFARCNDTAALVRTAHADANAAARELATLEQRARELSQRSDYLRFQLDEIDTAELKPGEDTELETESSRLEHAEELARTAEKLHQQLYASERSISSQIDDVRRSFAHLVSIDASLGRWTQSLNEAFYALEEMGRDLGAYAEDVEHDPARLETVRSRQDKLFRLRTKYGSTIEDILATAETARLELEQLDNLDSARASLESRRDAALARLASAAADLTKQRTAAAKKLTKKITEVLAGVGMAGVFDIRLTPLPEIGTGGAESVEFLIAVNRGFDPRPLARIASGGELSRVMLAIKTVLADVDMVPTLVFDEIDAGIGGRVANQVAEELRRVAAHHQVFVITHLPQLASRADHHLLVEKRTDGPRTATVVEELSGEERVRELARLLSGDPESAVSQDHARELLAVKAG
jgi:DNA repair protein RecN (Recombination protein N)